MAHSLVSLSTATTKEVGPHLLSLSHGRERLFFVYIVQSTVVQAHREHPHTEVDPNVEPYKEREETNHQISHTRSRRGVATTDKGIPLGTHVLTATLRQESTSRLR